LSALRWLQVLPKNAS